ncbi:MAG TPA: RtcB family protein [Candidatus Dormibacteraeota bacterium]|nr:RtcB family protein [Candidatus Dormibacteraeota bacterium]
MNGRPRAAVFDSERAPVDRAVLGRFEASLAGADLAAPPVVLPDFHHKRSLEMPSSIAVATRDAIHMTLTSSLLNCGMALVALDLAETPSERAVTTFYDRFREAHPFPFSLRPVLAADEVVAAASEGARLAVRRYDLDPRELDRVEEGGCLPVDRYGGVDRVRREISPTVVQLGRLRFGAVGPTNHYVELHRVTEVFDQGVAARLGVGLGQLTIGYHCGDGVLNAVLGARFTRRRAGSRWLRSVTAVQKPRYQLASARSLPQLRRRLELYFSSACPPVPRHDEEGERLMLANAMAMNYAFAYRQATYASVRSLARSVFGAAARLVADSPHNTVYEERVGGERVVVHRHNAARAYPPSRMAGHPVFAETGQPVLLPGTCQTSYYLCVGSEGGARSLFSACHGTGRIVEDFVRRGLSGPHPERRTTLCFGYGSREPAEVPHLDDLGVDDGLRTLVENDVVRPVARLRPLAVLR